VKTTGLELKSHAGGEGRGFAPEFLRHEQHNLRVEERSPSGHFPAKMLNRLLSERRMSRPRETAGEAWHFWPSGYRESTAKSIREQARKLGR
jgi:hypothetical protein